MARGVRAGVGTDAPSDQRPERTSSMFRQTSHLECPHPGPAIIRAKIILRRLWELQLEWDGTLPQDVHTLWMDFNNQLKALNEVLVPPFVSCQNQIQVQLHGFCDASKATYGACIYIRSTEESDQFTVKLLCAKSKMAPLKKISLPRLKLQAS